MENISSYCQTDLSQLPWLPLDQREALPNVPAVYFALGASNQVLYIGKSVSLNGRWKGHHRLAELQRLGNVRLAWIELESKEFLEEVEQALIEHFSPALNGQEVTDGGVAPVTLRFPRRILKQVDALIAARNIRIPRHLWLVEAVVEKIARDKKTNKEFTE